MTTSIAERTLQLYQWNDDPYSSHSQILQLVSSLPKGSRVLDVGAASGYLGTNLSGQGYYMAGIERNPAAAEIADPYYDEFIVGDVEGDRLAFGEPFDAIVLADILEHLRDPSGLLRRLASLLAPDGRIIVSLPNVANLYIRANALMGRFEYASRGICDRTHLRFFTWRTANALLEEAGFTVIEHRVTPLPLPLVFPHTRAGGPLHGFHRAAWLLAKVRRQLFGYQFIFIARQTS